MCWKHDNSKISGTEINMNCICDMLEILPRYCGVLRAYLIVIVMYWTIWNAIDRGDPHIGLYFSEQNETFLNIQLLVVATANNNDVYNWKLTTVIEKNQSHKSQRVHKANSPKFIYIYKYVHICICYNTYTQ